MKKVLLRRAIKLNKERKRRGNLRKIVQSLAAVVVFCTTYALILPAITMEQEQICGMKAHVHDDRCYETYPDYVLACALVENPDVVVLHSHSRECYDREGNLRCTLTERPAHSHEETCYGDPALVCTLPEDPGHVHSESCTRKSQLICTLPEDEGHSHSDACAATEQVLSCTVPESEGHTHKENCVQTEQKLVCTLAESEGHTHSDSCAATEQKLICTQAESDGHAHGEGCTDAEGNPVCTLPEGEAHTHGEGCYETVSVPCPLEEAAAHTHGEGCYEMVEVPCTREETAGHAHGESCYETRAVPCPLEERPAHTHGENCYELQSVECPIAESEGHSHGEGCYGEKSLICGKEEIQPHHHDENCYDATGVMNCGLQEIREHIHGEACLTDTGEVIRNLICTQEEHEHQDLCYAEEEPKEMEYLCGAGEHIHTETCSDGDGQLVCTIPEHRHTAACVIAELDLTADMETPDVWDAMFRDMPFTGSWPEDLVLAAQSQLGYRESQRNCALEENRLKGYTRYGARYEQPYGDWDILFVRFCMDYAGIRYYPMGENPVQWISGLRQQELFHMPEGYTPKPGDLVFLCREESAVSDETLTPEEKLQRADHVGIVTGWNPEEGTLRTMEGDVKDRVCNVTYGSGDLRILGYGEMLPGFATELHHMGEDYSVDLSFSPEAKIPAHAALTVREILPDTEEYETYYSQSVDSLMVRSGAEDEESLTITFARFFDISFTVNGSVIEPEAPVSVQIRYAQPISVLEEQVGTAVHFTGSGVELTEAALTGSEAAPAAEEPEETAPAETTEATAPAEETEAPETEEAPETSQTVTTVQIDTFAFTQSSFSVTGTVLTSARAADVTVWLDATCGGLMAFEGYQNSRTVLSQGKLPVTVQKSGNPKYEYKLKGWYDTTHGEYYPITYDESGNPIAPTVGEKVLSYKQPQGSNDQYVVFYADLIAANYDVGQNVNTVPTLNTNEFVTTHMFDYNALFNMHSVRIDSNSSDNNSHSEQWRLVELGQGNGNYGTPSLDFVFRDHDSSNHLSHPIVPSTPNYRNEPNEFNRIYSGLYSPNLISKLFGTTNEVLGKHYLGQGNYLFQYDDNQDSDYYGYYYYDSFKNAASYNASAQRFYVYNHIIHAYDTIGNNLDDTNADFLPFNYGQTVYASQRNQDPAVMANLNFGMSTNVHFYLPNNAGATDSNGNYLNKSTTGKPLVFEFSGDDDVWVVIKHESWSEPKLLLDIGGIHQARKGIIDFSRGVVRTTKDDSTNLNDMNEVSFKTILGGDVPVPEGAYDLTIYYLERGSSMSNCAIYFNLAPRYGLDLTKTDFITGERLEGVTFEVFNDVACREQDRAKLWSSHESAKNNEPPAQTFRTGSDGLAHIWGLVAGKTYYIRELVPPSGYPDTGAMIRVTLNNHGTDISEVTVIRPSTGAEGFEIISHSMNKENHLISLTLTNKRAEDPLTDIRAEKFWGDGTVTQVPVQVYLLANGEQVGEPVTLSLDNAWGHTWMDLPLRDADGQLIDYQVREVPLDGHYMQEMETALESDRVSWVKVAALENESLFLLGLNNGNMLIDSNGRFSSLDLNSAKSSDLARWTGVAYSDGFRLRSSSGRYLAFRNNDRTFYLATGDDGNQTFYYDGSQLFVMANNTRYYVANLSGSSLSWSTSGSNTALYKQIVTYEGTTLFHFTNTPIPAERQRPLTVEKFWDSDITELPEAILIHVKQDGVIQATLELNQENGWKGMLNGLDVELLENGGYTLEEAAPFGFVGKFSEIQDNSVDEWHQISGGQALVKGDTYVFVTGSRALADDNGTPKATNYTKDAPKKNQCWQVLEAFTDSGQSILVLRNVETGRFLREYGRSQNNHEFTLVSHADGNCAVRLYNSRLQFYPQSNGDGWSVTINSNGSLSNNPGWGANSGTAFSVYRNEARSEFYVTVTNSYAIYYLPETGGSGTTSYYTFGGLLMLAAALMYTTKPKRRRQKGGR